MDEGLKGYPDRLFGVLLSFIKCRQWVLSRPRPHLIECTRPKEHCPSTDVYQRDESTVQRKFSRFERR